MNFKRAAAAALSVIVIGSALPATMQFSAPVITSVAADNDAYDEVTKEKLTYKVFSDYAEVSDCDTSIEGEAVILPEINGVPVTKIGAHAFEGCVALTDVSIPESVASIEDYAFLKCEGLEGVSIPYTVTRIGKHSFQECTNLTNIRIPNTVTSIGEYAFYSCSKLEWVVLSDKIKSIEPFTFTGCTYLATIQIPNSVESIGESAFSDCYRLNFLVIPGSVKRIGKDAFTWYGNDYTNSIIHILNPECEIYDDPRTICSGLKKDLNNTPYYTGFIYGYSGSTTEAYAKKYGYVFTDLEEDVVRGDINGDNYLNIADLVLLKKWLLGVPNTNLKNWKTADLCCDNKLNVYDFVAMKQEITITTVETFIDPDEQVSYGVSFYTTNDGLKLYRGPDEFYESIATIPKDTYLRELGYIKDDDKWLFTEYEGQYGWVRLFKDDNKTMTVYFEVFPDKPVIYLYPEKETDVHVELELTEAELSTTYPRYNGGWNVTAYPDGTLLNKADGSHHRYLFWDAANCRTRFDLSKGFCVAGSDTESFLKEKLTYMGLTEEEMNEFIVYWLPRMEHNAYNLISFQGDAYTDSAKLNITPTPDSICRIFMTYVPLENAVDIEPQQFETFERKGFTVVEWGGTEIRQ